MKADQLKNLLHTLHDELEKTPDLDSESRRLLEDIAKGMTALASGEGHTVQHEDLITRLEDAVE